MGKRQYTVQVQDAPGAKKQRVAATPGEPETAFPEVVNDAPQPEVYGFGAAQARADAAEADEVAEPPARPDGLATIAAGLAAARVEASADAGEPVGDEEGDGVGAIERPADAGAVTDPPSGADALPVAERDALVAHLRGAHPDAVPELITGDTVAEIVGSVTAAKAAHARVATQVAASVPVAAGGGPRGGRGQDLARLSPLEKISAGLREVRASR